MNKIREGKYLIWLRLEKRLVVVRVVQEADLVVDIPGRDYKPYVGVMNCWWLLRLRCWRREGVK